LPLAATTTTTTTVDAAAPALASTSLLAGVVGGRGAVDVHPDGGLPDLEHEQQQCEPDDGLEDGELDNELLRPLTVHGRP
jgi:hypothetical protein